MAKDVFLRKHIEGGFYDGFVVVNDANMRESLKQMRQKLYQANVDWKYHCVLSFSPNDLKASVELQGGVGGEMSGLMNKLRSAKKVKMNHYFWKYEEGRKSERPHYHLLVDMAEISKTDLMKKIFPGDPRKWNYAQKSMREVINRQKRYWMNKDKTDTEILLGMYLKKLWGKGITFVRKIRNKGDLVAYVEKDISKESGTQYKQKNAKSWQFSRGIPLDSRKKGVYYQDVGIVDKNEACRKIVETKHNFIRHFNEKGEKGAFLYFKLLRDIKKGRYRA